ncbi:YaiO family outer membrane beta-barrel protein [Pontibacter vulgaris]|uniref:YaiO family outer membrane beta-barrel protein n=1 Tax=Pontibacter vulgaris TaxID=2905679 RepID=UPI001FA6FDF9|nr:YaiO family outer membrane beta-barrel protein [Pontibacter vulgaris]
MIKHLRAALRIFTILTIFILSAGSLFAQVTVNTDSLLQQAQKLASQGKYKNSRQLAKQVLQAAPTYTDAVILIGRTYAWESKYDSARTILLPLTNTTPTQAEALQALADVELWSGNPSKSLLYAEKGLQQEPASVAFLLAKARAQRELHQYKEATITLQRILALTPNQPEALQLIKQIEDAGKYNRLRADYQLTTFNQDIPNWHLGTLEYSRQTPENNYVARVNVAERFEQQSIQGELEAYPRINEKTYAYLNLGISDGNLFPEYRAGAEVYRMLPYRLEASVGTRLLFYSTETVTLFTGHIGKYFPKYWASFRPYLQRQNSNWQTTGILQLRRYFRHEDEFLTLTVATGSTPLTQVGFEEISRLNSNRAGLEGQFRLSPSFLLGGLFMFEYEEYQAKASRNRFTTGITLQHKF